MRRAFGGDHARADRRPEAGDLRVPRRRRLRLPRRRAAGGDAGDARGQLAQRPGADRRLRRAVRRRQARPRGDRLPAGPRDRGQPAAAPDAARPSRRRCGSASCTATSRRSPPRRAATRATRRRASTSPPTSRSTSCGCSAPARSVEGEPIEPGHVAVLVQTNRAAALVRDALGEAGDPGGHQRRRQRVRDARGAPVAAAAGGDRAAHLRRARARRGADAVPRLERRARSPARPTTSGRPSTAGCTTGRACCATSGVASLLETITLAEGLPARVLAAVDGERRMTDLRHVGQLLHAAATTEQLGTDRAGRLAAAADRRGRPGHQRRGPQPPPRVRRPGGPGADGPPQQGPRVPDRLLPAPVGARVHPARPAGRLPRPAGGRPPHDRRRPRGPGLRPPQGAAPGRGARRGPAARLRRADAREAPGRRVVGAVVRTAASRRSGGCCSRARPTGPCRPVGRSTPTDAAAWARFEALAAEATGCISVERSRLGRPEAWSGPLRAPAALTAARFDRELDRRWRRTSFTDITSAAYDARVASEPEEALLADEPEAAVRPVAPAARDPRRGRRSSATCRWGRRSARSCTGCSRRPTSRRADLDAELAARVARGAGAARAPTSASAATVVAGLRAAIETPLGDGLRLRDLARADRLDELDFEFPLVGGDEPTGRLALDAVAAVLRAQLRAGRPARRLRRPAVGSRAAPGGARLRDRQHRPRARAPAAASRSSTTRRTGSRAPGEELTAWHHRPAALAAEMERGALRAAGAALPRRAAPLPALAAARLRPRARTWAA